MIKQSDSSETEIPPVDAAKGRAKDDGPTDRSLELFFANIGLPVRWQSAKRWQQRLSRQNRFARLVKKFGAGKSSPLFWGVPRDSLEIASAAALQMSFETSRKGRHTANDLPARSFSIDFALAAEPTVTGALVRVHLAQIAPLVLAQTPPKAAWIELQKLVQGLCNTPAQWPQSPLFDALLEIELPLTLAHQLPDIESLQLAIPNARRKLEESVRYWLDEEGLLELKWWPLHRAVLASWLRSMQLLRMLDAEPITPPTQARIHALARNARRATYSGESALLVADDISCGMGRWPILAKKLLSGGQRHKDMPISRDKSGIGASSESAGLTLMQTGWKKSDAKLAVAHADQLAAIHLWRVETLLAGECFPLIEIGEHRLEPKSNWEVSCWHCDDDVQVLHLELKLDRNVTLERTLLLANKDKFLFLADAVLSRDPQTWSYSLDIPLGPGITALADAETSEVYLRSPTKIVALVIPLAGGEWKSPRLAARFETTSAGLTLRQTYHGRHLFAPLFVDLKPRRSLRPHTWRSVTVARNRASQPSDVAVGYRVRSGNGQWLFFRSFGDTNPFSVFSKHLACDFYVGRIEADHSITDLIQFK